MIRFIRKRLSRTILTVLAASVALVSATVISLILSRGIRDRTEMMTIFGDELAASTYAGIKHPMSVGDSEAIEKHLLDLKEKMKDVTVLICDFNEEIIYATHAAKLKARVKDSLTNQKALRELKEILITGEDPRKAFKEEVKGKRYLVTLHPILNQPDCYHCHGSSRKVLGGIIIKMNADRTYESITATRRRSIALSALGIAAIIALTYAMLAKLVSRPIEILADKARRFAEGDMSVHVDVKTEDEIGVLGKTFNYMVGKISSFSRELEVVVARRTMMLRDKTLLLERANRELRELDRLKTSFLANMSHELRTPMNSIIGYSELLLDGVDGPVNDEQAKSLRKVESNARHLLQLINDILDMSKIESGKIELDIREIDMKKIIASVTSTLKPSMDKKGLKLILDFDENLPPVYADEDKVMQILINLLSNSIKFTNKGEITIRIRPSERGVKPGEPPVFVEVCVEDTGIGIKDSDIDKLFDKFSQLDISTIRQYEGTGLGLSIARGLVVLHKGVIWATSEYGKGSRFCFTLPTRKDLLEKPAEPIIEPLMARGLADYFNKPVETFLNMPLYAGKQIKCWEYFHCGQTSCPAYGSKDFRCWLHFGTHCKGTKVATYPEKIECCKGCEIIERLIVESEEFQDMEIPAETQTPPEDVQKKTVLAIDDNPEAIEIIRKFLGENYHVTGLLSSKGIVDKVKELKPIAITLDIMMPGQDGWQVLQELKSTPETQDIPVIILSIVDDKKMGFSLGAAEYIVKPVEKEVLLRKLKNLEKLTGIKKILVVDNDPEAVELAGNVLSEAGYLVTSAYNSKDAIKSIQHSMPDLIVLNLTMPGVSGFDVIEYIRTEEAVRDIPLIVLTRQGLTEKEVNELNGRIQGILNRGLLTKEDLLKELSSIISKCSPG
ncbi:MAG: response regulator [Nitrospirota bacterium]|nr:response regulator [Nitrospirota bacterium]